MKPQTVPYKMNVPTELMEKLKQTAADESRSVSAQIIRFLRSHFDTDATTQK